MSFLDYISQFSSDFLAEELFNNFTTGELIWLSNHGNDSMLSIWIDTYFKENDK